MQMNSFNLNEATSTARSNLNLPQRGRLDAEQTFALQGEIKRLRLQWMVDNDIIEDVVANVAYHVSFPEGVEGHMTRKDALAQENLSPSKYSSNGGPLLEKILNAECHNGLEMVEWEEEAAVAAARPTTGAGRPTGSKNRSKEEIDRDRAITNIRREARNELKLPARGRLSEEDANRLEALINKRIAAL